MCGEYALLERKDMKINKVDHICVAVRNLDDACAHWGPVLGKSEPDLVYVDEPEKIKVARYNIGEVGFELMESTKPDGEVARFIENKGEGLMLVSFHVDSTRDAAKELQDQDYPLIPDSQGKVIRPFRDAEFTFVHPKKLNGVLTELIDVTWDD
jgi:methylmalonyl-CoA/ethylmalonyl-CoA epimerase